MTETELVSETLAFDSTLTRLMDRENFIKTILHIGTQT